MLAFHLYGYKNLCVYVRNLVFAFQSCQAARILPRRQLQDGYLIYQITSHLVVRTSLYRMTRRIHVGTSKQLACLYWQTVENSSELSIGSGYSRFMYGFEAVLSWCDECKRAIRSWRSSLMGQLVEQHNGIIHTVSTQPLHYAIFTTFSAVVP